jgi:DNA primase
MEKDKKEYWVDYKEIKEKISLRMVLDKYQVFDSLKLSGLNYVGCCPIHQGSNTRQFSANLERNIWQCFGDCQAGGNIIDFVAKMENTTIRQAALLLKGWFIVGDNKAPSPAVRTGKKFAIKDKAAASLPLSFELKNLQTAHPFFDEKRIKPETIQHFGLGFCTRGLMKGRIAIPLHNCQSELMGYCGRAVEKDQEEKEGKYKLPPKFEKKRLLYNLNRLNKPIPSIILVESFLSVWKLHEAGLYNAVSLLGSIFAPEQETLLREHLTSNALIYIMFDNDENGQRCQNACVSRLSKDYFVKVPDYKEYGQKPHHLEAEILKKLLS